MIFCNISTSATTGLLDPAATPGYRLADEEEAASKAFVRSPIFILNGTSSNFGSNFSLIHFSDFFSFFKASFSFSFCSSLNFLIFAAGQYGSFSALYLGILEQGGIYQFFSLSSFSSFQLLP